MHSNFDADIIMCIKQYVLTSNKTVHAILSQPDCALVVEFEERLIDRALC